MSAPATRRVRRMWAYDLYMDRTFGEIRCFKSKPRRDHVSECEDCGSKNHREVLVLDASPAAMEAHVEAMAEAFQSYFCPEGADPEEQQQVRAAARAALAALMKGRK